MTRVLMDIVNVSFLHSLASPKGEAAARRRLMRGSLIVIARQWMVAANPPLIRPSATFSLR
ncbi:MAG: hypothetical protein UF620_10590, partial [Gemmiger sp.]|uniref:hypothetical protein n=1 Tax=Gemmiger sp. TaxID=2049027 RepID=UPI002E7759DE